MGRRGPQSLGYGTVLRTTISAQTDAGLNELVALTGVSKATLVRRALLDFLANADVVFPETAAELTTTKTAGLTRQRQERTYP